MKGTKLLRRLVFVMGLAAIAGCVAMPNPILPTTQQTSPLHPTSVALPSRVVPPAESLLLAPALRGDKGPVTQLLFSPDGKMLVSGSDDGSVILWDVRDPKAVAQRNSPVRDDKSRVRSVALSPDGSILVISTSSGTPPPMHLSIWDVSDPGTPVLLSEPPPLRGGFVVMYTLAFSPDGRVLAIGSEDRTVSLWDMTDPALPVALGPPLDGHQSPVRKVVFSPDGRLLASGAGDGAIILWSMSDPKAPARLVTIDGHGAALSTLAFGPDGKTLAAGDHEVRLWDVSNPEAPVTLDALLTQADEPVVSLDISPDGNMLASGSGRIAILWDVSDRSAPARLVELRGHRGAVSSVAFSADGKTLATGSADGAIILWNVSESALSRLPRETPRPPEPPPIPAMAWPMPPLTGQQIASVKECDIESLAAARYPDTLTADDLQSAFAPQSGCDWAVLAFAYGERLGDDESSSGLAKSAFSQAVADNFGFALATPIFYRYFGSIPLVKAPALAQQEITDISIQYRWAGLGDLVRYAVEIHQANTTPAWTVTPERVAASLRGDVDREMLQALAPALTNLLPVGSSFSLSPCTDNYPDWDVTLTFADSTTVHLTTDSNFVYFGGPWFTEIDHQTYIQFSTAFAQALRQLVVAAGLPVGETAAMTCFGDSVFDKAFP